MAIVSKKRFISANLALLTMFHSVLKCTLYARSSRSTSFWYLSIENGGGVKGSRPCSLAKRAYIACIMSWISAVCRAALRRSRCGSCAKKSLIARAHALGERAAPRCARACGRRWRAAPRGRCTSKSSFVCCVNTVRSAV